MQSAEANSTLVLVLKLAKQHEYLRKRRFDCGGTLNDC
jgi:hypothetical protein